MKLPRKIYGVLPAIVIAIIGLEGGWNLTVSAAPGMIRIDPEYPRSFRYDSGDRFFPMGDTAYFLVGRPTNVIARYIDSRREHEFNFIRMMALADGFWPFGGTVDKPDYARVNDAMLKKLDWIFDYAAARGMNIELILWGYGSGGGEGLWKQPADQVRWIETIVRRYKSRMNLFLWTIANEFERYPDGQYRYEPADVDWAREVAARIRKLDPLHAIGCHPSVWITDQDSTSDGPRPFGQYNDFTQRRPPIVWPLWHGSEVNVNVTQNNEGVQKRTWGNFPGGRGLTYYATEWQGINYPAAWTEHGWDFDAAGLEDSIAEDWLAGKPVLNLEFGYQHEPGYQDGANYKTRQVHQPAAVRKKAWKIATSGAYFAAGFESTAVRHFSESDVANIRPQQLKTLYQFFTGRTEYWKLAPHLELVDSEVVLLAAPGREYVAYFPGGRKRDAYSVTLQAGSYTCQWLHPATGEYYSTDRIEVKDGPYHVTPPDRLDDDWVWHCRK